MLCEVVVVLLEFDGGECVYYGWMGECFGEEDYVWIDGVDFVDELFLEL